ncbi:hypothetical protein THF1D04_400008 [Vibrio owensii]|uniref:DUF2525 domain-containing protein n=1 Tax=Vibrio owensii TaxID=696485 RepID=A0AAU9QAS1_9VIBR|nr:hypothetical protein THF1D04_400008 [Vibrio owensii]
MSKRSDGERSDSESSPKNNSLVLSTEYECQQAKNELAYLEENFSEVCAHQLEDYDYSYDEIYQVYRHICQTEDVH